MRPFTKTVLLKFGKWYLESQRGQWWKRKYFPIKTVKKLSDKLLCVLLVHLTELQLSLQEAVHWDYSCEICKVILENSWRAMVKKEISSVKNWKEAFWETVLCLLIHLTDLQLSHQEDFREVCSSGIWKVIFRIS